MYIEVLSQFGNATVIALGEATHGSRDKFKILIVRLLITRARQEANIIWRSYTPNDQNAIGAQLYTQIIEQNRYI
jgi:hypothetical protein